MNHFRFSSVCLKSVPILLNLSDLAVFFVLSEPNAIFFTNGTPKCGLLAEFCLGWCRDQRWAYCEIFYFESSPDPLMYFCVHLATWGICTAGTFLPLAEHDWLKWSRDKIRMHNLLSWPWRVAQPDMHGRVLSWFQCWQAVSGFLSVLHELYAKP